MLAICSSVSASKDVKKSLLKSHAVIYLDTIHLIVIAENSVNSCLTSTMDKIILGTVMTPFSVQIQKCHLQLFLVMLDVSL